RRRACRRRSRRLGGSVRRGGVMEPAAAVHAVDVAAIARELGFVRAAIVPIEPPRRHALYTSWVAAGHAGEMAYLARPDHVALRADLHGLLDSAKSLVVVALAYDRADP